MAGPGGSRGSRPAACPAGYSRRSMGMVPLPASLPVAVTASTRKRASAPGAGQAVVGGEDGLGHGLSGHHALGFGLIGIVRAGAELALLDLRVLRWG